MERDWPDPAYLEHGGISGSVQQLGRHIAGSEGVRTPEEGSGNSGEYQSIVEEVRSCTSSGGFQAWISIAIRRNLSIQETLQRVAGQKQAKFGWMV